MSNDDGGNGGNGGAANGDSNGSYNIHGADGGEGQREQPRVRPVGRWHDGWRHAVCVAGAQALLALRVVNAD